MPCSRRSSVLLALFLVVAGILLPAVPAAAAAEPQPGGRVQLGRRVFVRYRPSTPERTRSAAARSVRARRVGAVAKLGVDVLETSRPEVAVMRLRGRRDVVWASREVVAQRLGEVQNQPARNELSLDAGTIAAGRTDPTINLAGAGIKVAVIDDGVWNTKDLCRAGSVGCPAGSASARLFDRGNCSTGTSCSNTGAVDADAGSHGTAVATLIAATDDADDSSGVGIEGVAPAASVYAYRVFAGIDSGASDLAIALALIKAADDGAHVANLSLGTPYDSRLLRTAFEYARTRRPDMVVVAAAGNDGGMRPSYPAGNSGVLSVGASERTSSGDWVVADFSTRGDVDVLAPGVGLRAWYTDQPGRPPEPSTSNTVGLISGTSFAAPLVSGMIAGLAGAGVRGDRARAAVVASAEPATNPPDQPAASGHGRADMLDAYTLATGTSAYTAVFLDGGAYVPRQVGRRTVEAVRVDPAGGIDAAPVLTTPTGTGTLTDVASVATSTQPVVRRRLFRFEAAAGPAPTSSVITVATGDDTATYPLHLTRPANGVEGAPAPGSLPPQTVELDHTTQSMYVRRFHLLKGQQAQVRFTYPADSDQSVVHVWSPVAPEQPAASDAPWLMDRSGLHSGTLTFSVPRTGTYAIGIVTFGPTDAGTYQFGVSLPSRWRSYSRRR